MFTFGQLELNIVKDALGMPSELAEFKAMKRETRANYRAYVEHFATIIADDLAQDADDGIANIFSPPKEADLKDVDKTA